MWYALLADLVVALHVVYVSYVLFGQLVILAGVVMGWRWARNPWFRGTHLVAILFVAFEAIVGWACPLTVWEGDLRTLAGQEAAEGTFMGRLLHDLMFFDAPMWVFTCCYIGFAALVLGTFAFAPPRRSRWAFTFSGLMLATLFAMFTGQLMDYLFAGSAKWLPTAGDLFAVALLVGAWAMWGRLFARARRRSRLAEKELEQKKLEEQAAAGPRPTSNGVVTEPVVSGFRGPQ